MSNEIKEAKRLNSKQRDEEVTEVALGDLEASSEARYNETRAYHEWYEIAHGIINRAGGTMIHTRLTYGFQQAANNAWATCYGRNGTPAKPEQYSALQSYHHQQGLYYEALKNYEDDNGFMDDQQRDAANADPRIQERALRLEESRTWLVYCEARLRVLKERYEILTGEVFRYQPFQAQAQVTNSKKAELAANVMARIKNRPIANDAEEAGFAAKEAAVG